MGIEPPFRHTKAATTTLVLLALALGCSTRDPDPPHPRDGERSQEIPAATEKTIPMAGLFGALDKEGNPGPRGGSLSSSPTENHLSWHSLADALPSKTKDWKIQGDPLGDNSPIRGIPAPRAKCQLSRGSLTAEIEILDTMMNPLLSMPYNLARAVQVDSAKERIAQTRMLSHPATKKYNKQKHKAEILIMVGGRILVTVTVHGAANENPAMELAKSLNLNLLSKLAGGQG